MQKINQISYLKIRFHALTFLIMEKQYSANQIISNIMAALMFSKEL
jgi:hypothetical protein